MSSNWEKFGEEVFKTVQDAVENKNYDKLNQMISDTMEKSAKTVARAARTTYNGYKTYTTDFEKAKRASKEAFGATQTARQVPAKVETKLPSKVGTIAVTALGYALGGVELVWCIITMIALLFASTSFGVGTQIVTGIFSAIAAVLSVVGFGIASMGTKKLLRMNRFQTYLDAVKEKEFCNISELVSKVGKNTKTVIKDLEYMIRKRWFLQGHLDKQKTCLIATDQMYRQYQQLEQQKMLAEQAEAEKAQEPKAASEKTLSPEVQKVIDQGDMYVRKIRKCNDDIPGVEISEKIYRIEMLVDKIFDRVEQNPKNISDIRKLMEYYLPTTVKLLEAYAEMDAQPVGGENIQSAKKEIEDTLDTLNVAFEKLLDDMFQETAWDVSSDISVLNTMLAQEGLKEDGLKGK